MTIKDILTQIGTNTEYDFLYSNKHLGHNIILLGLGGSYAYGTNVEGSDIDIRGIALNSKREILLGSGFEQVHNEETDTVIYSFNKMIKLLTGCNPNTIEILGLKPEHYIYLDPIGEKLLANKKLFLSQRAAFTFGAYASAQLRRLDNKSARVLTQSEQEAHILNSIKNASEDYKRKYFSYTDDNIKLYTGPSQQEDYDTEIFMDLNLNNYPLRDWKNMWSEMNNIVKDYAKIGSRNAKAIEHNKLGKHMCHLIRLYMMCLDILENEEIVTYREKEHNLLMSLRNGEWLTDNKQPIPEFMELVKDYEKKLEYAKNNTSLPKQVDMKKIDDFVAEVNEQVVLRWF